MLPVNAQSSFLHLSLFYFQPSPSIPRRDRSLPPQCGEAARRIGNKGVHLPCLPTHCSHPDPHKGVMQVARSDSPWGARDVAAALKSHGAAPKSRRRMMPDPPPPSLAPQWRHLVCYEQTAEGSAWVQLPTDRSATAGTSGRFVRKGRKGKNCPVGEQKKRKKSQEL